MRVPASTYRLQFGREMTFEDARRLVLYLDDLGITDLYASPLSKARAGSAHGYDVTDPTQLNPEMGTPEDFDRLVLELRSRRMGLLLDIVPNHMAMSSENPWWMDVLEHGRASRYAKYFDIDWQAPALEGKVLVPILGSPYAEALERGELTLSLGPDGLFVRYLDQRFPISPRTYDRVLGYGLEDLGARLGGRNPAVRRLRALVRSAAEVPSRSETSAERKEQRARAAVSLKRRLWETYESIPEAKDFIEGNLRAFEGHNDAEDPFDLLDRLMARQAYLLSYWRMAPQEIDYRRFFDISDLVSVHVEDPEVFEARHAKILELYRDRKITGLRVDHVDGLHDPLQYLARLQAYLDPEGDDRARRGVGRTVATGQHGYVVVEKILAEGEDLPDEWPVAGTTGYEFLNALNSVQAHQGGVRRLGEFTASFTGTAEPFDEIVLASKRKVMEQLFASEVLALGSRLRRLARDDRHGRDLSLNDLQQALVEVTAAVSVYRTYVNSFDVGSTDRRYVEAAVKEARRRLPPEALPALDFLRRVLLLEVPPGRRSARAREWLAFLMRWQQFTGPVMAKGAEDTALYLHNRLVSRNEVGGEPGVEGLPLAEFHRRMRVRSRRWPHSLSATSTHDTKRSEDVRARLNVLSEMPGEWAERVERWSRMNAGRRREVDGREVPDPNEELHFYQNLLGGWPLDRAQERALPERMRAYMEKAAREAKVHTSWTEQNAEHERALSQWVTGVLARSNREFRGDVREFLQTVGYFGAMNALSQTLVKITAPGVPDFYQGTELWSPWLVDPDNRRPIDFERRIDWLRDLRGRAAKDRGVLVDELMASWPDGRIKLYLTAAVLEFRRANPELFAAGSYQPLEVSGRASGHLFAFARHRGSSWCVVVASRLLATLAGARAPVPPSVWGSSTVTIGSGAPERWIDVLSGREHRARPRSGGRAFAVREALAVTPIALLTPS